MSTSDPRIYYVYILASRRHGTLYTGVTNDLIRRVQEHREKTLPGFTKRYGVVRLVYFEMFGELGRPSPVRRSSSAGGGIGRLR